MFHKLQLIKISQFAFQKKLSDKGYVIDMLGHLKISKTFNVKDIF